AAADHTYAREIAGRAGKAAMCVAVEPIHDDAGKAGASNSVHVEMPHVIANERGDHLPELRAAIHEAITQGVDNALQRGSVLGFPVTRTKVSVTGVQFFGEALSTAAAYRACAAQALLQAFGASKPVLLEPVARISVVCGEAHVGAVLSDLNGVRKGRVLALANEDAESLGTEGAMKVVDAEVPLSTMLGYASQLRSLTAGSGTFSMEVTGFGPMPAQQQQQVIKESQGYY
ncbi:Ribosome-releasing factor 2, mitochondrial, partial [Coemansia sp. IMI 209127]